MTKYKLGVDEKRGLLMVNSIIDSGFDCDDPVYGPTGKEMFSVLQETEVPGFELQAESGKVHYISPDGKKYKVIAGSLDKITDEFIEDEATRWEERYTEIFFTDERGRFITKNERGEIEPLVFTLQKRFDTIYNENWKETLRLEDDDISPDDVD